MSPLRLNGSTSGYSQLDAPAVAGDQTFTLPGTGGTLDRLNRAGNILQVVNATYSTNVTNTSLTYVDTGLSASITPTSASNKILVIVQQAGASKGSGNADSAINLRLLRDSTALITFAYAAAYTGTSVINYVGTQGCAYLDSPATTSAITYKTQIAAFAGIGGTVQSNSAQASTIVLLEVAA